MKMDSTHLIHSESFEHHTNFLDIDINRIKEMCLKLDWNWGCQRLYFRATERDKIVKTQVTFR